MLSAIFLAAGMATSGGGCSCATTFDAVRTATESNYAGYQLKLPDEASQAAYRRFAALLRADTHDADSPAECRELLDAYLAFFADEHLFVATPTPKETAPASGASPAAPAAAVARATGAPEIPNLAARWTPEKVEFRLRRENNLDPIEGLWRDDDGQFAIVADDAVPAGEYIAFRFSYRHGTRPGEVIGFVRPNGDGTYAVQFKDDADVWQRTRGTLNNETGILTFANRGWQRTTEPSTQTGRPSLFEEPERKAEAMPATDAPSGDPLRPVLRDLGDGVLYLSMPSFAPRFREPLVAILAEHGETLASSKGLIVDVRGNAGGDAIYYPLADYLLDGPIVIHDENAILASEWNTQYMQSWRQRLGDNGAWLDPVIKRMQANPGEIVPYLDRRIEGPDIVHPGPERVVVLQDRGTGSAAEAFLLHMGQSGKVVTMGEPSKGNIDYQQVTMRTLGCGDYAVDFGYPLYLRTRDLPKDSLDDSGIAPDVRLAPALGDWIDYAERWLKQ